MKDKTAAHTGEEVPVSVLVDRVEVAEQVTEGRIHAYVVCFKTTLLEQLDMQRQCFRHVTRMRRPNSPTSGVPIYPTYPSLFLDVSWPQTSRRVQQSPGWLSGFSVHIVRNEAAGLLSCGPITL